jgi:hypothetical protein
VCACMGQCTRVVLAGHDLCRVLSVCARPLSITGFTAQLPAHCPAGAELVATLPRLTTLNAPLKNPAWKAEMRARRPDVQITE